MIRINLLDPCDLSLPKEELSGKKTGPALSSPLKKLPVIVMVALVAFLGLYYFVIMKTDNQQVVPKQKTTDDLSFESQKEFQETKPIITENEPYSQTAPEPTPKPVLAYAVEEAVKEIEGDFRKKQRVSTYKDFSSASKIDHQILVCKKTLSLISEITPPNIGFTDLIVSTTPGDLYIRGIASSRVHYQNFLTQIKNIRNFKIRPGLVKAVGDKKISRDFSLYGTIRFKRSSSGSNRVIRNKDISFELTRFRNMADVSGVSLSEIKSKSVSNAGVYRRYIYQTRAGNCTYAQFQSFVNTIYTAKSPVGILKFTLRSGADERVNVTMDLMMYTR
ncbi:MAG: hypothetical protein HQK83_14225 [Fibrobacteria bacterium]|nr:hypothetical protein [Fibrobacteria bacterium]